MRSIDLLGAPGHRAGGRRDECLDWASLRRDWCKDTLLVEPHAVGAPTVGGCFESGTPNLSPSTVSACDGSSLSRGGLLVVVWRNMVSVWRYGRTTHSVGVWSTEHVVVGGPTQCCHRLAEGVDMGRSVEWAQRKRGGGGAAK